MDLNKAIEEKCSSFATDMTAMIRQEITSLVQEVQSGKRRLPSSKPSYTPLGLQPGEKRSQAEIDSLTEELYGYIKKNPGLRIELIAKGMDRDTRELNLPLKKLVGAKRVKGRGQKRATTYVAVA